ncbi:hypothetical protein [Pleionea mediterranea]|uniref:Lipoprotein n=1 Tax=Pleionea mediterranea TaxID=523701 RepID=A0A316FQ03_9GAMM|nr:hypothetical protein [Pleionea mediterranea]PWK50764.1 hypothetical protein C8D97_10651 [Pleionea mediterranea]
MTLKKLFQISILLACFVALSGCAFHGRHHGHYKHGHHHSRIHLHGHMHGKPSHVVGALIAGAVIGHAIESAAHRAHERQHDKDVDSNTPDLNSSSTQNQNDINNPEMSQPNNSSSVGSSFYMTTPNGECLLVEKYPDGKESRSLVNKKLCNKPQPD